METNITSATPLTHSFWKSSANVTQANLTVTPAPSCGEPDELQSSLAVAYALIFIPGLIGNLVALWVFLFVHSERNSVQVFLVNIALADLLLMVCLPFRVLYHSRGNRWTLGPTLCNVVGNLFYMNMYMSVSLLGMISVDRYLKIRESEGLNRRLTTRGSTALCALTWAGAVTLMMPVVMSKEHTQTECQEKCFHYKQLFEAKWKAYINITIVAVFWLVFITLTVSYTKIGLYLRKKSDEKPDLPNASRYRRSARKSFFILFLFTVCFVPYHLVRIFYIQAQITETAHFWRSLADRANEIALVFSAFNSCLDPVMYFFLSSAVRKEVWRLLGRVVCLRAVAASRGSNSTVEMDRAAVSDKSLKINVGSVNTEAAAEA